MICALRVSSRLKFLKIVQFCKLKPCVTIAIVLTSLVRLLDPRKFDVATSLTFVLERLTRGVDWILDVIAGNTQTLS